MSLSKNIFSRKYHINKWQNILLTITYLFNIWRIIVKRFYKFIALLFIFMGSLYFFSKSIPEATIGTTKATTLQDAAFPIMYIELDDYTLNTLHGYSGELNSGNIRESITPLGTDKSFMVKIDENNCKIKRLDFQLRDIANNKIIESNTLTAFEKKGNDKYAKIKITESLDTSTEYGMQITLTTNLNKKIHFYTRIKYYENDFYLTEKLDFINKFHQATFDKGQTMDITSYLEANTSDDSTYANVNINSNYNLITWGKLNPEIISDIVPTIKEINIETASVELNYYIKAQTASGQETYHVKEFYRVRYSGNRIYLLAFNRNMEAEFNPDYFSLKKSQFKIGISNESDFNIVTSSDNKSFAFVRNGSLWFYDIEKKKLTQVFSFSKKNPDYLRDNYDQHNIKILKINKDKSLSFVVYGYMNCGDYEGRVGIILYDYTPENNQIKERVYIPLETTYQQLKEDFGKFCYVNDKNIFYFSLNDIVYAYNISSKRYEILSDNCVRDNFVMLNDAGCFVWSDFSGDNRARSISILDLETSKKLKVSSSDNENIVVLGTIDSNVVYGYVKDSDIYESTNGEVIKPVYKLIISDCKGNILRKYQNKNIYITSATVDNDVIRLKREKKVNGIFRKISDDSILNQKVTPKPIVNMTTRVTDKTLTEKYLSLPSGLVLDKKPSVDSTKYVTVTENTTLHIDNIESDSVRYYVYAYGGITGSYTSASKAIQTAQEQMGVVVDNKSHIVWERGGKFISKELSGISYPPSGASSIKSATHMLLQGAQCTVDINELNGNSIISMLNNYLDQPVDLTGCTLDEVLYFVSSGKPVIGMLNNSRAVVITAYDKTSVTWMDPSTYTKSTVSLLNAENQFKQAGYVFVSYVSN